MTTRLQRSPRYGRLSRSSLAGGVNNGIRLSGSTFTAAAAQGTAIGSLTVAGGTGTYTFTLTDSHSNAVQVAGANGVNLQVGSASSSVGSFSISIHADNGAGSTFDRTFLITALVAAPTNTIAPVISGATTPGSVLTVSSNGTWTGSPTFTYQWKRDGSPIAGQTLSSYTTGSPDDGHAIICTVTGTNASGSASADSNTINISSVVAPNAPVLTFVSESAGVLSYTWALDSTIGTGDTVTYQYQTAGAGWVSPTSVPHVIQPGEDTANTITPTLTLANGTWDVRGFVTKASTGLSSGYSNVDASRVVSDVVTANYRIASTGNRRISSVGNYRKAS